MSVKHYISVPADLAEAVERYADDHHIETEGIGWGAGTAEFVFENKKGRNKVHKAFKHLGSLAYGYDQEKDRVAYTVPDKED